MKKITYFFIFITLLFPLGSLAGTLVEVIQHTLATNPEVLMTIYSRRAVDEKLRQAQGEYLPSVDLNARYGQEKSQRPTVNSGQEINLTRQESRLTLSQILFDGFNTKNEIEKQQSQVHSAAYQIESTSAEVALQTIEAYLEVLRRQELVDLNKDNVVVHQKIQEQISTLVKGGAGRQADKQQSDSRIALAKAQLVDAQGQLRSAEITYLRIVGELPKELIKPPREMIETALPDGLQTAYDHALHHHAALKVVYANLETAQSEHERTRAHFMPHFRLELEASKNKNLDGIEGQNDDLSAMVKMRYNLYQGGKDQALRQEAVERINVAKEAIQRTQRTLEEGVHRAWNSLTTIQTRLEYLKRHVESTQEVLESYKEQLKLGQRSLLDVLDSENELFNARSNLTTGQYIELLSMFRVLASMGILLETLKVNLPQETDLK